MGRKVIVSTPRASMSKSFASANKLKNIMRARGHGVSVHLNATASTSITPRRGGK